MSDSDTGETSHFKIKHIEPATNAEDTANTSKNCHNASNSQNDDNQTLLTAAAQIVGKNKKRKIKRKKEPSPESSSSDSGNSPFSEESVEEVILLESTDSKIYLKLRVTNGSLLVKWQTMSINSLNILFDKRMKKRIF